MAKWIVELATQLWTVATVEAESAEEACATAERDYPEGLARMRATCRVGESTGLSARLAPTREDQDRTRAALGGLAINQVPTSWDTARDGARPGSDDHSRR